MNSKIQSKDVDFLFDAILQLQTRDECYMFFEDLCTVQELKALSQRLTVAKMLSEGRVYSDIVKNTGAMLIIAPLIIMYLFCQRYLVEGIERSGIVG